ncbi:hypothetical protein [Burkholderia cepacia]|uniref:hypothetical protein n=1 Tax=Burkholderia cepacia TaxID=292 RepID=UPI00158A287D|nr:hypothetical protein [Burkholderia cepacia]
MLTAPGGDAFAADGKPVNFLLFGGAAHLRRRVGIGDPNGPQAGWRHAFGYTQPGSTLSFASGGPLSRAATEAFVALPTTSAEQVGTTPAAEAFSDRNQRNPEVGLRCWRTASKPLGVGRQLKPILPRQCTPIPLHSSQSIRKDWQYRTRRPIAD